MEHEILEGEQFLDYIVERITLQDALPLVLRLLVLFSLVNGGLKDKDYDTIRKEVIQVLLFVFEGIDVWLRNTTDFV